MAVLGRERSSFGAFSPTTTTVITLTSRAAISSCPKSIRDGVRRAAMANRVNGVGLLSHGSQVPCNCGRGNEDRSGADAVIIIKVTALLLTGDGRVAVYRSISGR